MIKFQEIRKKTNALFEALTTAQKKTVNSWGRGAADTISKGVFPEGQDRMHIPLEHSGETAEPHPLVKDHLENNGYSIKDYKTGIAQDKHGRDVRIGKALEKTKADDEIKKTFANDPIRSASSNDDNLKVIISKHPHDVAGMSTDRGWTSCMNMKGGCYSGKLQDDIKNGTHVAYLVHKHDDEIKRPLARIALKPYHGESGHTVIRPESTTYGGGSDSFSHTVKKFAEKHYPLHDTIYRKDYEVYDDSIHNKHIFNDEKMTPDEISHQIKNNDSHEAIAGMIRHPNASAQNVSDALKHPSKDVRIGAIMSPKANKEHLETALNDADQNVVIAALKHHKDVGTAHITKGLQSRYTYVRAEAARHPKANQSQISQGLSDEHPAVREMAISNPNATEKNISKALNDDVPLVRIAATTHKNATRDHYGKALFDDNRQVRASAAYHTPHKDQIYTAMSDSEQDVRESAMNNKHATEDHLIHGVKDTDPFVRGAAIRNRNATQKILDIGAKDRNYRTRYEVMRHPAATEEHLIAGLQDEDSDVRFAAHAELGRRGILDKYKNNNK